MSAFISTKSFWTPYRPTQLLDPTLRLDKLYDRNRFFSFWSLSAATKSFFKMSRVEPPTYPEEQRNSSRLGGNAGENECTLLQAPSHSGRHIAPRDF